MYVVVIIIVIILILIIVIVIIIITYYFNFSYDKIVAKTAWWHYDSSSTILTQRLMIINVLIKLFIYIT